MQLNSPSDLFLYELSAMYDAETKSAQLFGEVVGQIQDPDLAQFVRAQEQQSQQKIQNLEECFSALDTQRQDVACLTVDGMRAEFQAFYGRGPSAETMQLYALGSAMRLAHLGIAGYRELVDKAVLMAEAECAQILQTSLVQKEENAAILERIGHEMSERVLAAV
jgi:ferritin-like metal-binding protein YciE